MRWQCWAMALALLSAPPIAFDARPAEPAPPESFAVRSLKAGRIQATLAQLAARRAESPDVKRFAAALARELAARNERLARIVSSVGARDAMASVPGLEARDIPERTRVFRRLRARVGAAFDMQFLKAVIVGHENAIRGYETETRSGHGDIRALAAETVPRLMDRLDEARRLLGEIERKP